MHMVLVSPIVARSKFYATIGLVCVFLTTWLHGSSGGNGNDDDDSSSVPRHPL